MTTSPSRRRMTPDELEAAKERANLKRRIRRLWVGDSSFAEICEEVGMAEEALRAFAAAMGLADREEPEFYLPSKSAIRLETARIRAGWTQAEREARLEAARTVTMKEPTGDDNGAGGTATGHRAKGGATDPAAR